MVWNGGKLFIIGAIVLTITFVLGTFKPNSKIVNKIKQQQENETVQILKNFGLHEPAFKYKNQQEFVTAVLRCVDYINLTTESHKRIPDKIISAMADVESAAGTSRFASEGNALFGVRTWDPKVPQMKPQAIPNAEFGVKKYANKCRSVADVIEIINRHPAYRDFRAERNKQLNDVYWNYDKLVPLLAPWSTNPDYAKIILSRIKGSKQYARRPDGPATGKKQMATHGGCNVFKLNLQETGKRDTAQAVQQISKS